ncbi:MAG: CPBP family intramembrane metalloprotease [Candidatus Heimdallarchaeota archaeon]|nr:CPBP family intramembrane metalloprotease [Candidatus Heimdallarchaeota archaeon]
MTQQHTSWNFFYLFIALWGFASFVEYFIIIILIGIGVAFPALLPSLIYQISGTTILFFLINKKGFFEEKNTIEPFSLTWGIKQWFQLFGVILGGAYVIQNLFSFLSDGETTSVYNSLASNVFELILLLIVAVIMAPVVEELAFRRVLIPILEEIGGTRFALLLSALIFSSIHWLQDILGSSGDFLMAHIFTTFVLGMLLGYLYIRTRDIKIPIIVHGFNNFIGFVPTFFSILYPFSSEEYDLYASGDDESLSTEAINNIMIFVTANLFVIVLAVISLIVGVILLIKNFSKYSTNFKEYTSQFVSIIISKEIILFLIFAVSFIVLPIIFANLSLIIRFNYSRLFFMTLCYFIIMIFAWFAYRTRTIAQV